MLDKYFPSKPAAIENRLAVELTGRNSGYLPFNEKFRYEFPEISMGEWYRIFWLTAPEWNLISPFHSQFCPQKLKMADSPELLFALEIFSDLHNFPEKRTTS